MFSQVLKNFYICGEEYVENYQQEKQQEILHKFQPAKIYLKSKKNQPQEDLDQVFFPSPSNIKKIANKINLFPNFT